MSLRGCPTKVSTLFECLSKVVTPDGPSRHLVYLIVVDLVLVLNIQVIMYINTTLNCDHYEQLSAKCMFILYAMFLNG
jgi:hypothetical protein